MTRHHLILASLFGLTCTAISIGIAVIAGRTVQIAFVPVALVAGLIFGWRLKKEK